FPRRSACLVGPVPSPGGFFNGLLTAKHPKYTETNSRPFASIRGQKVSSRNQRPEIESSKVKAQSSMEDPDYKPQVGHGACWSLLSWSFSFSLHSSPDWSAAVSKTS